MRRALDILLWLSLSFAAAAQASQPLLDGELGLNASVFHSWRDDQQARASFQLVPNDPASFGFATINIDGGMAPVV